MPASAAPGCRCKSLASGFEASRPACYLSEAASAAAALLLLWSAPVGAAPAPSSLHPASTFDPNLPGLAAAWLINCIALGLHIAASC